jgi:hypothetical protein
MTDYDDKKICEALRQAFPPVDETLRRDLWPMVLSKLDGPGRGVPWYDWALIAVTVVTVLAFPRLLLIFAYHL